MWSFKQRLHLLLLVLFISILPILGISNTAILKPCTTLSCAKNETLVSQVFELGFFALGNGRLYLGIWYKDIPGQRTYVWVANRDRPLRNSSGSLEIFNNKLLIRDLSNNETIWESEEQRGATVLFAELLNNGNFVLRSVDNPQLFSWQSFNLPSDTLLPEMKLRSLEGPSYATTKQLACWKEADLDPAKGEFAYGLSLARLLIFQGEKQLYRSGAWNDVEFTGVPLLFKATDEEGVFVFSPNTDSYTRLVLNSKGSLQSLKYNRASMSWQHDWEVSGVGCDKYNVCGANSYCANETQESTPTCVCLEHVQSSANVTSTRCMRKKTLSCSVNGFSRLMNMKWPDTGIGTNRFNVNNLGNCKKMCLQDCHCTAVTFFVYPNGSSSSSCVTWKGDLVDLRNYTAGLGGQDLFIRLEWKKKESIRGVIIGVSISITVTFLCIAAFYNWKKKQNRARETTTSTSSMVETMATFHNFPPMEYTTLCQATHNFSQQIGEGGFGKVYKGKLVNVQEIAVKKLSYMSSQGATEFQNEIESIARLQHVNIVQLHGWCVHHTEKILVYEYMCNGSLERHLFEGGSGGELGWDTRFKIIKGIAKGLDYIKDGDRNVLLHRDLKPANILLDAEMTPKISDFGLARTRLRNETDSFTERTVGTRSYMSPEYAIHGIISDELDIYSYGVTVLEIVTGMKHKPFSNDILLRVWDKRLERNWTEILDRRLLKNSLPWDQKRRCVDVGLNCVQTNPADRMKISIVVAVLEDHNLPIPYSRRPEFFATTKQQEASSSGTASANLITLTNVQGR